MITYLNGELTELEENSVTIECYGVGYEVLMPISSLPSLPAIGNNVKIYTYQNVKEDALDLFGFISKDDLKVFKLLITVNGIGPKGALNILSAVSTDELRMAVIAEDVKKIQKIPGIGSKTAQRLIIELKDKMNINDIEWMNSKDAVVKQDSNGTKQEAVEALVALGYSATESLQAVNKVFDENLSSEALLKVALKQLAFM